MRRLAGLAGSFDGQAQTVLLLIWLEAKRPGVIINDPEAKLESFLDEFAIDDFGSSIR